ncbi:MAG: DUF1615 domain-containing protein [Dokdonella sp.]
MSALCACLFAAGCATTPREPSRQSSDVRSEIVRRMSANVQQPGSWAVDIQTAFEAQNIEPNSENICAVIAITEQETGFRVDPLVPNLAKIARAEIDRRAAEKHVPKFVVDAALKIRSPDGRSYAERLKRARTERDLSGIYEDLIGSVPLGKRLFANYNPVETAGPMQVSVSFAEANARSYPYLIATSLRDEVFTQRGGMYFGIAHLLGYRTPYTRKVHRFADYNAGWYASRNAAFQNAVAIASGRELALDGDLIKPGARMDHPGETERAVRALASKIEMDDRAIRQSLSRADRIDFDDSNLVERVYAIAEGRAGKSLPHALIPGITLKSPKITRNLTTAWFATRVDGRYQRCMQR